MTPHIKAKKEEIAKTVIMPGDPLRAKYIAENYLQDVKLVNDVRGMLAFTGTYKGIKVTIMGHGMGIPSIGIYSYELFKFYDVQNIIRIGSCGAYSDDIKLGQLIIGSSCVSTSTFADCIGVKVTNNRLEASKKLVKLAHEVAKEKNIDYIDGLVLSADVFYSDSEKYKAWIDNLIIKDNLLAAEMEGFGLYANANKLNKEAICLVSVSDSINSNKPDLTSDERVTAFKNMMLLSLEMMLKLN